MLLLRGRRLDHGGERNGEEGRAGEDEKKMMVVFFLYN